MKVIGGKMCDVDGCSSMDNLISQGEDSDLCQYHTYLASKNYQGVTMSIKIGSRPAKQVIKAYTDILQFGKRHKGHTVEYVLKNDPGYILWMDENGWTIDGQIVLDAENVDDAYRRDEDEQLWWLYDLVHYRD